MTKLFSLKSLAFAGAAAFALTLAAAPQADAAESDNSKKITLDVSDISKVKVVSDADKAKLTKTDDGFVIYYQLLKNSNAEIKENKFIAITDENLGYYNLTKLGGKEKYLVISPDGKADTVTGVAIKAAPKLKIKYNAGADTVVGGLEIEIDKEKATKIATGNSIITVTTPKGTFELKGVDEDIIKSSTVLGNTIEVTATQKDAGNAIVTPSKVAKLKVAAKPKAPKISLKLDATKEFKLKIKQQYKVEVTSGSLVGKKSASWVTGEAKTDKTWSEIIKAAKIEGVDTDAEVAKIVSGDAILTDLTFSFRTPAPDNKKKAASAITVVKLEKSADAPTSTSVKATMTGATYKDEEKKDVKTATSASIKASVEGLQYSVNDGESWKKMGTKDIKIKDDVKKVLVRVAGNKTTLKMPSLVTTITIDTEKGTADLVAPKANGNAYTVDTEQFKVSEK